MAKKLKPKTSRKKLKPQKYIQTGTDGSKTTIHKWQTQFLELLQQEGFYERIIDYYTQHPSGLNDFPTMILGEPDKKQIQEINIQDGKFVKDSGRLKRGHFYLGYRPEPSDTYGKPSGKGMYYIVYVNPTNDPDEIGIMMISLPHLSDIVEYGIRPTNSLTDEKISIFLNSPRSNEGDKYSIWQQNHASGINLLRNEGALIETNLPNDMVKDGSSYKGNMDFYPIFDEKDYLGLFNWWW